MSCSPPEYELPYIVRCLNCNNFANDNICQYCCTSIPMIKIIEYTNNCKNNCESDNFQEILYENKNNIIKLSKIYDEICEIEKIREKNFRFKYDKLYKEMDDYIKQCHGDNVSYALCSIMYYISKEYILMSSEILFPIDEKFYEDITILISKLKRTIEIIKNNNIHNICIFCEKRHVPLENHLICGKCYFSKKQILYI